MVDVINGTEMDVIYEVDDGSGGGADLKSQVQKYTRFISIDDKAAGYLSPAGKHKGVLWGQQNLRIHFCGPDNSPLASGTDLSAQAICKLVPDGGGQYKVDVS